MIKKMLHIKLSYIKAGIPAQVLKELAILLVLEATLQKQIHHLASMSPAWPVFPILKNIGVRPL